MERTAVERLHVESELDERGLEQTDSQANFSWFGLGERDEDEVMRALGERGVIVRGGAALGPRGLAPGDLRHARGERPLPRRPSTRPC